MLQAIITKMMANPIILIVAAIAAAVAAFIHFWNTSEEFRQFWIKVFVGRARRYEAKYDELLSQNKLLFTLDLIKERLSLISPIP